MAGGGRTQNLRRANKAATDRRAATYKASKKCGVRKIAPREPLTRQEQQRRLRDTVSFAAFDLEYH